MDTTILHFPSLWVTVLAKKTAERAGHTSIVMCGRSGYRLIFHVSPTVLDRALFLNCL